MSDAERSAASGPEADGHRLSFRAAGDRGCPNCGEIALAYDPSTGRARCCVCGETA